MISNDIFRDIALSQMPRILGLEDRVAGSKSYGCFDRYYWHYWLSDTSNARMQEAVQLLALLYTHDFPDNVFFGHSSVYNWCLAGFDFCKSIQRRDGSFDEIYPNEQSFVSTSFLLCALSESIIILKEPEVLEKYLPMIEKGAKWLTRNNNPAVSNQMAGSAAALLYIYKITSNTNYKLAAIEKLNSLLKLQDPQGYLLEYGGWDIGYLSISIAYLGKIIDLGLELEILNEIKSVRDRTIAFILNKVNNNGTYDNALSSRKTQYLYPSGFITVGEEVLERLRQGLVDGTVLNPSWMDDRFCIPLTVNYLQTYFNGQA